MIQPLQLPELSKKAQESFVKADRIADTLEKNHFELTKKYEEAEDKAGAVKKTIRTMPSLQQHLTMHREPYDKKSPPWKKAVVATFSKALDLGIAIADRLVLVVGTVYAYTLEPVVAKFSRDVSNKLQ